MPIGLVVRQYEADRPLGAFSPMHQHVCLLAESGKEIMEKSARDIGQGRIKLVGGLGPSSLWVIKWKTVKA